MCEINHNVIIDRFMWPFRYVDADDKNKNNLLYFAHNLKTYLRVFFISFVQSINNIFRFLQVSTEKGHKKQNLTSNSKIVPLECWRLVAFHQIARTWSRPMNLFQAKDSLIKTLLKILTKLLHKRQEYGDDKVTIATKLHWLPKRTLAAKTKLILDQVLWRIAKWRKREKHVRMESWNWKWIVVTIIVIFFAQKSSSRT